MTAPQDLAAAIDRWDLVPRLVDMQRQRLILGGVGLMASVGYNLWHPAVESPIPLGVVAGFVGVYLRGGAGRVAVRRHTVHQALVRQVQGRGLMERSQYRHRL